jgi:hypothetical protein
MQVALLSLASIVTIMGAVACMPAGVSPPPMLVSQVQAQYVTNVPAATAAMETLEQVEAQATAALQEVEARMTEVAPEIDGQIIAISQAQNTFRMFLVVLVLPLGVLMAGMAYFYLYSKRTKNREMRLVELAPLQVENEELEKNIRGGGPQNTYRP